jgi:integrase
MRSDGRAEYRVMQSGKMKYVTAKTMKELKVKLKQEAKQKVSPSDTVAQMGEKWLKTIKPIVSAQTYIQYSGMYKNHVKPLIGDKPVNQVTQDDVQTVINTAFADGLSTNTMLHIRKVIKLLMDYAIKPGGIIQVNPVCKIKIHHRQAKEKRVVSPADMDKLVSAMAGSRWLNAVKFLLATGMRRGEMLSLKWDDVNSDGCMITVRDSGSGKGTKSRKIRYVPLSADAVKALADQNDRLKEEGLLTFSPYIFPNRWGKMKGAIAFNHSLEYFAGKAGIKVSPHMFRHTFVYTTRHALDIKELQKILGHARSTQTLDLYGDIVAITDVTASKIQAAFESARNPSAPNSAPSLTENLSQNDPQANDGK